MPKSRFYTEQEITFIRENYRKMSDIQIGDEIGRTELGITNIRSKLKLIRHRPRYCQISFKRTLEDCDRLRKEWVMIQDMKALIILCQLESRTHRREIYKKELLKLSNLKKIR